MHRPGCRKHPQAVAVARCVSCGEYLCGDCVVEVSGRAYCGDCARKYLPTSSPAASGALGEPGEVAPPPGGSTAVKIVATCAFHPGVRAVTRCAACGALICAGCQRPLGDRRLCQRCYDHELYLGARRPPPLKGPAAGAWGPSLAGSPWKLWPALAFLPVPLALNGVMTYMMRQGERVSVGAAQLFLSLVLYSLTLAFAFVVVSRYGPALQEVGFRSRNLPASIGLGLAGGVAAYFLAVASAALSVYLFEDLRMVERWLQGFFDVNVKSASGADILIAGAIIVVVAPLCEEIFFRGYLYPPMRRHLGVWGAALINGLIFSAVHFSLFGLIGRTLAGAIFCLLYEQSDNLWSPIAAHAVNNFVAFFLPLIYIATT